MISTPPVAGPTTWCRLPRRGVLAASLTTRSRVLIAQGELEAAERDAFDTVDLAARLGGDLVVPFALDCLATAAAQSRQPPIGRSSLRRRRAQPVNAWAWCASRTDDEGDDATVQAALRDALGALDFESAWTEGAALSVPDATAYAPSVVVANASAPASGWGIADPRRTRSREARLLKAWATRRLPHGCSSRRAPCRPALTHIYTKLGLTSRVQLAQESARRA